ncbi:MAG TPA: hypothetical protein VGH54_09735 [Mycobacterium sp.]|uniref:hypothetical protein n=1 Tax=Mycobacterium sp. TaxID=1785 RepID=UPI002F40B0E4
MKAAEHFAAAERCLDWLPDYERGSAAVTELLAEAQVHATLAVAASQMRSLPAEQDKADAG